MELTAFPPASWGKTLGFHASPRTGDGLTEFLNTDRAAGRLENRRFIRENLIDVREHYDWRYMKLRTELQDYDVKRIRFDNMTGCSLHFMITQDDNVHEFTLEHWDIATLHVLEK